MLFPKSWQDLFKKESNDVPRLIPQARESGFIEGFDGCRIYWELHGPTPSETKNSPQLFCYGLACSMNQWRAQLNHFKNTHPCILFDYRGHHKSDFPSDPRGMNLSALAKDAARVLKHLVPDQRRAHIWGHSMGANVAIELAFADPGLCRSLVLCCGSADNPFKRMFHSNAFEKYVQPIFNFFPNNKEYFYAAWKALLSRPEIGRHIVMFAGFNRAAIKSEDVDTYVRAVAAVHPKTFFPLIIEMTKGNTQNILSRILTPTLVVAGGADLVTPPDNQRNLARDLPNAEYFEIPTGSHNVQLDFGDYVCLKAEEFWIKQELDNA
ncbi:alpha/beta hydrolase [bacterium]|nr:alpha/beta hydrolase [bacterium]